MRVLIPVGILAVLTALYTSFWFTAAGRVEGELEAWMEKQRARGWEVSHEGVRVSGYPFRLAMHVTQPILSKPATSDTEGAEAANGTAEDGNAERLPALRWEGEALVGHVLPYNLNHVIVQAEGLQRLTLRRETTIGVRTDRYEGTGDAIRASLVFSGGEAERLAVDIEDLRLRLGQSFERSDGAPVEDTAASLTAERVQLHTRLDPDESDLRLVALRFEDAVWAGHGVPGLGDRIAGGTIKAKVSGAQSITLADLVGRAGDPEQPDRMETLLRDWRDRGGALDISEFKLDWAPLDLAGGGRLLIDGQGRPEGEIALTVNDPERFVEALADGGVIKRSMGGLVLSATRFLARLNGEASEDYVRIPIEMKDGRIRAAGARVGKTGTWIKTQVAGEPSDSI